MNVTASISTGNSTYYTIPRNNTFNAQMSFANDNDGVFGNLSPEMMIVTIIAIVLGCLFCCIGLICCGALYLHDKRSKMEVDIELDSVQGSVQGKQLKTSSNHKKNDNVARFLHQRLKSYEKKSHAAWLAKTQLEMNSKYSNSTNNDCINQKHSKTQIVSNTTSFISDSNVSTRQPSKELGEQSQDLQIQETQLNSTSNTSDANHQACKDTNSNSNQDRFVLRYN